MSSQPLPNAKPVAEVELTSALVTGLLEDQHPDLAHLVPVRAGEGWDNATFRLGDHLAVRLPRRTLAANLIGHEHTWLPRLAAQLPIPVPAPYRVGRPARGYPWRWSVVPWLSGQSADLNEPAAAQAPTLGAFLRSLHVPAPVDAPINPWRGGPLWQRNRSVEERLRRLGARTDLISAQIRGIWETGLAASMDVESTWLHGDLHPRNVLVEDGRISGIIDWGDITSGDCATDLASIWMLFRKPEIRDNALAAYAQVSEATLQRAKAWAVFFVVMFLDSGLTDNPENARLGKKILQNVAQQAEP
jgi:aminoglycoside phosphotransferase (APT) family kinase protein